MLEGIVTGYEERFDFPLSANPAATPYLLATVPRTGSTWFSHLLWRTGCLGAPLEYLNFKPGGPWGHAAENVLEQDRLWKHALNHRTSPNGVFGLKAFPVLFEELSATNPPLVDRAIRAMLPGGGRNRVIELRRRDREAQVISYARAILSGVWHKQQERGDTAAPVFDRGAADHAARMIERQEQTWQAMYRDLRIEPLVVWYEDALKDPQGTVGLVARHLGVAVHPAASVDIPEVERQSQRGVDEWKTELRTS